MSDVPIELINCVFIRISGINRMGITMDTTKCGTQFSGFGRFFKTLFLAYILNNIVRCDCMEDDLSIVRFNGRALLQYFTKNITHLSSKNKLSLEDRFLVGETIRIFDAWGKVIMEFIKNNDSEFRVLNDVSIQNPSLFELYSALLISCSPQRGSWLSRVDLREKMYEWSESHLDEHPFSNGLQTTSLNQGIHAAIYYFSGNSTLLKHSLSTDVDQSNIATSAIVFPPWILTFKGLAHTIYVEQLVFLSYILQITGMKDVSIHVHNFSEIAHVRTETSWRLCLEILMRLSTSLKNLDTGAFLETLHYMSTLASSLTQEKHTFDSVVDQIALVIQLRQYK